MSNQNKPIALATRLLSAAILVLSLGIPTIADEPVAADTNIEETSRLSAKVKEIFRDHCAECHSAESATAGVSILDHADLIESGYIEADQPDDSLIYQLMTSTDDDVMPPITRQPLTSDEMTLVREWIKRGAAKFPSDVKSESIKLPSEEQDDGQSPKQSNGTDGNVVEQSILKEILQHVRAAPESQRRFLRFFSLRHLVQSGSTPQRLRTHRLALTKAINHLSRQRELVIPQAIDDLAAGTIFVIDLRDLGWHHDAISRDESIADADTSNDPKQSLDFFDLVLLEYPYSVIPESNEVFDRLRQEFLKESGMVRPIPFLNADWFCSTALQPPLYHDILQLPLTLAELESDLGVDVASNLQSGVGKRAGMTVSGVSRNNRAVERHPQRDGYYWKSHDFLTSTKAENILADPVNFRPSGGEMIFRLPNGMQGYYVADDRGQRLDAAPTKIVVDKFASDRIVRNGLGCIRCHGRGIKNFQDVIHNMVQELPGSPGFDKRAALTMYPPVDDWKDMIAKDQSFFTEANQKLGIDVVATEPLSSVTSNYLEGTIDVKSAAAMLEVDPTQLSAACKTPALSRLGLAPLATKGVIRRDSLEHNYGAIATRLGLGIPVVPIDGTRTLDELSSDLSEQIQLVTNKANQFFEPGDELRITVKNQSEKTIFFELFGTSVQGESVRLSDLGQKLAAGESFVFPPANEPAIKIQGGLGREQITLFAADQTFAAGRIYRGKNIADRIVHPLHLNSETDPLSLRLIKRTLIIETR